MKVNTALLYILLVLGSFSLFSCAAPASSSLPDAVTESALTPTPSLLPTNTPTPMHTPASIGSQEPALYVFDKDFREDIYIVKGSQALTYQLGDSLVVYGEITPSTEIAIALLRIVKHNPDSLSAQAVLVHPNLDIRPSLRVDSRLDYLLKSELVPSAQIAIGYVLGEGRVYLRPDRDVKVGDMLEALEPEIASSAILDYLPFDPPVLVRVTAVGSNGRVARVELVEGTWSVEGTILRPAEEVAVTTLAATVTPVATPGVYLIAVTEFHVIGEAEFDPVAHIKDALVESIQQSALTQSIRIERYSEEIADQHQARDFGQRAQADIVIWGRMSGTSLEINGEIIRPEEEDPLEPITKFFYNQDEGTESYQFFVRTTPDFRKFVQSLGAFTLGKYESIQENNAEAITFLSEALQIGEALSVTGIENVYLALGNAKFMNGDANGTIESYDRALSLNPGLIEAYYNRASANVHFEKDIESRLFLI